MSPQRQLGGALALGHPQLTLGAHEANWKWLNGDGQLEMTGTVERSNLPFAPIIPQKVFMSPLRQQGGEQALGHPPTDVGAHVVDWQ